jgi:SAM-dependent methyltransferase
MTIDNEKNKAFWNEAAQRSGTEKIAYAGMLMEDREFEALYRHKAECKHLLRLFAPKKEDRVLEVGSGGGRWGYFFAGRVHSYVGLDVSSEMVARANEERARQKLENIIFLCEDLLSYDTGERFKLVYFSGVLQYMDDSTVIECVQKASKLLAEGGIIVSRDSIQVQERVEKDGHYPVVYRTIAEYEKLFAQAGFKLEYTASSYPRKRFTDTASRIYRSPLGSYRLALVLREFLCLVDSLLGHPDFLKSKEHKRLLKDENPQEHRFFKYVRLS